MFENDSTYIGQNKSEDFYFKSPIAPLDEGEDEYNRHIVFLSEKYKRDISNFIKNINGELGLELPCEDDLTSYNNPDYLWLSYELEHLRRNYNNAMIDLRTGKIGDGLSEIPYVQLRLQATAYSMDTLYPKSTLNRYGSNYKPHYVIEFEQPFLLAFMKFIAGVFDDNPQMYVDKGGKKIVTHQFIAPIYRQKPFDKYFNNRHDIPAIMFNAAVTMLLGHELAHVGQGHLDLQAADKVFGADKNTMIIEEREADSQAMCWLVASRFLDVELFQLEITFDDLFEELTLSVFSVYMLFTWMYSKEARVWDDKTVEKYGQKDHLPYQLRAYSVMGVAISKLETLSKSHYTSLDGKPITSEFAKKVMAEVMSMVYSFECSYHMFFAKTQDVYNLTLDGKMTEVYNSIMKDANYIIPMISKENIPFALGLEKQGQQELKRVNDLWKDVRERLQQNGHYCRLVEYKEWEQL